jgi:glyoxylase-like metal-dependent hydrolase (beta-lactamase superfamily II)
MLVSAARRMRHGCCAPPLKAGAEETVHDRDLEGWTEVLTARVGSYVWIDQGDLEHGDRNSALRIAGLDANPDIAVPELPGWQCVHTPGHTRGHAAFFPASDGVLMTGDAVVTVDLNLSRRPPGTMWDLAKVGESIKTLANLETKVLASGTRSPYR